MTENPESANNATITEDPASANDATMKETDKSSCSIRPQLIAGFSANLSLLACGLCFAWPTSARLPFVGPLEEKWVNAGLRIGACIGPIPFCLLLNVIGRKWSLYLTAIPLLGCWILTFLANSWVFLFVARLLCGLSIGAIFAIVPIYHGEISEPRIRGANITMMGSLFYLGCIIMYVIGPRLDLKILAMVCLVPTIVFLLTMLWMPETPHYHKKKKNEKSAELSLIWLRRKKDNDKELTETEDFVNSDQFRLLHLVQHRGQRNALVLLAFTIGAQQLSGLIAINSYTEKLLVEMNLGIEYYSVLAILGVVFLVTNILSALVIDRFGRKPIFLISTYGVSLCLIVIATYLVLKEQKILTGKLSFVPLIFVVVYYVFLSVGLFSIPFILTSEIFAFNVKSWATMIISIFGSILGLIVEKCYPLVISTWNYHVLLYGFALLELIIATVGAFTMPETTRKTFKEIQSVFDSNKENDKSNETTEEAANENE